MDAQPQRETRVGGHGCDIAVCDYGGHGPAVLLLHGAASNLLAWSAVVPHLATSHRVLAMDLRGHGRSGDASWNWNGAVGDVAAVLEHFECREAALVGHSLGGILALIYASQHAETTAVVNVDGHSVSIPDLAGADASAIKQRLRDEQIAQAGRRFSAAQVGIGIAAAVAHARAQGVSEAVAEQSLLRCLRQLPDGSYQARPDRRMALQLIDALDQVDPFLLYPELRCPLLIVSATRPPELPSEVAWLEEIQAAQIAFVNERLRDPAAARLGRRVVFVDTTHTRILLDPGLPTAIHEFIA